MRVRADRYGKYLTRVYEAMAPYVLPSDDVVEIGARPISKDRGVLSRQIIPHRTFTTVDRGMEHHGKPRGDVVKDVLKEPVEADVILSTCVLHHTPEQLIPRLLSNLRAPTLMFSGPNVELLPELIGDHEWHIDIVKLRRWLEERGYYVQWQPMRLARGEPPYELLVVALKSEELGNGAISARESDSWNRVPGGGQSATDVQRTANAGGLSADRMVAVCRHTECESPGSAQGAFATRGTVIGDDTSSLVVGVAPASRRYTRRSAPAVAPREQRKKSPGVRNPVTAAARNGTPNRRPGLVHPEWALVIGGGSGVWDEILEWEEIYGKQWDGIVVAANDVGVHWPRALDHWVTLHPEKMLHWMPQRASNGFSDGYETWGRRSKALDHQIQPWSGGASGMMAVQIAQVVGCVRAVLCGIPMTPTAHFKESTIHPATKPWKAVAGHWRAWEREVNKMQGWVRSMSGRTLVILGGEKPTLEWLLEGKSDDEA
jgi:hypothetical protein